MQKRTEENNGESKR